MTELIKRLCPASRRQLILITVLSICLLLGGCAPESTVSGVPSPADDQPRDCTALCACAEPDPFFNTLFTRSHNGWTGGDGTYSVPLPDGRTVWMFGDTFLGGVGPGRSRSPDTPMVRNALVVQDGTLLTTLCGGSAERPADLVPTADSDTWYWPGDGTVEDGRLRVFMHRFTASGPGMWDWQRVGSSIADFGLPQLRLERLTELVSSNGVMYGAAIYEAPDATYVYGTREDAGMRWLHLARAPKGQLLGRWHYYGAGGWSEHPSDTVGLLEGAAVQVGVLAAGDRLLLITMDNRHPFGREIVVHVAEAPEGPWGSGLCIYRAPEAVGDVVAYNAVAHPQFERHGRILLSYNLNHVRDSAAVYRNADLYRPRFIRFAPQLLFQTGSGWQ